MFTQEERFLSVLLCLHGWSCLGARARTTYNRQTGGISQTLIFQEYVKHYIEVCLDLDFVARLKYQPFSFG